MPGTPETLSQYLRRTPRYRPSPRSPKTTKSTRNVSAHEIAFDQTQKLHGIVNHPELVDQLLDTALAWADHVAVDPTSPDDAKWLGTVDPHATQHLMPPTVNSETDTVAWFLNVFLRAALSAIRASLGMPLDVGEDPGKAFPWAASSESIRGYPVPDGIYSAAKYEGMHNLIDFCLSWENKTGNAMPYTTFSDIHALHGYDDSTPFAIPFVWPTSLKGVDKSTRILTQVFSQMVRHRVHYSVLSSYDATIFFYWQQVDGKNILFMSPAYQWHELSLGHVFAWLAQASGVLPESIFQVPQTINMECVNRVHESTPRSGYKAFGACIKMAQYYADTGEVKLPTPNTSAVQAPAASGPSTTKRSRKRQKPEIADDDDDSADTSISVGQRMRATKKA